MAKALPPSVIWIDEAETVFRSGKVKGIRFRTLARLCAALDCKPGDLLDYDFDAEDLNGPDETD